MANSFKKDLDAFQAAVSRLTRLYQMRGRDDAYDYGLSVSQAYLITIMGAADDGLTMGQLSAEIRLDGSSTTRAVDALVKRGLVTRKPSASDRRIVTIHLTEEGESLFARIEDGWLNVHRRVLKKIPVDSRGIVIEALGLLAEEVVTERQKSG